MPLAAFSRHDLAPFNLSHSHNELPNENSIVFAIHAANLLPVSAVVQRFSPSNSDCVCLFIGCLLRWYSHVFFSFVYLIYFLHAYTYVYL